VRLYLILSEQTVLNIVVTKTIVTMHIIILLATFNLLLHRKNKKLRNGFSNSFLETIFKPDTLNNLYGEKSEQIPQETAARK
jgi:hypothetical protein